MCAANREDGQSLVLVVVAMGIFLLGAVGLGFDGSHMYSERTRAQLAADAAAQAAMIDVFNGTSTFGTTAFTCTTTDTKVPCVYARNDGFGGQSADTVSVSFPADSAAPGINFSSDTVHLIQVTVSRNVSTTFMRLLGPTATTVSARAMAAIVSVVAPTPIVVTHPTLSQALYLNGNTDTIKICGGPTRSIQVNSSASDAFRLGAGLVDLSHAGPPDTGNCLSAAAGHADFAVYGGPPTDPGVNFGTGGTGKYISGAFPIDDPFANVPAPPDPGTNGASSTIPLGTHGCAYTTCTEYTPGVYTSLDFTGQNIILDPGVYYVKGGGVVFKNTNGGQGPTTTPAYNAMCSGCSADTNTGNGVVIYDTHATGSTATKGFDIDTLTSVTLYGSTLTTTNSLLEIVPAGPYYGMLLWEDRTADAHTGNSPPKNGGAHTIGQGNGCFTLIGNIYMTNTKGTMTVDATHYQQVQYNGTPCSTTVQQGYIIVSALKIVGTTTLSMTIPPYGYVSVRKVALVN